MPIKKKILLVEDDGLTRMVIKKQLEETNFEVETAINAREAIQISRENDFDLVLLDLNLPDAYGLEISSHLNQPFIAMTATSTPDIEQLAIDAGGLGFIVKPFKVIDILDTLLDAIEISQRIKPKNQEQKNEIEINSLADNANNDTQKKERLLISIGCIMASFQITEREAFNRIKNTAESNDVSIDIIAKNIIKKYQELAANA